jgi:hypothetical protein
VTVLSDLQVVDASHRRGANAQRAPAALNRQSPVNGAENETRQAVLKGSLHVAYGSDKWCGLGSNPIFQVVDQDDY